jgi:hypothetical protein
MCVSLTLNRIFVTTSYSCCQACRESMFAHPPCHPPCPAFPRQKTEKLVVANPGGLRCSGTAV